MSSPVSRPIGEIVADVEKTDPALAAEVKAALSAKRVRDDLADAELLLREHASTARDAIGRAIAVLLVEYDRRAGRVLLEPQSGRRVRPAPRLEPPPASRTADGDRIA
jgi:hypothetical protein